MEEKRWEERAARLPSCSQNVHNETVLAQGKGAFWRARGWAGENAARSKSQPGYALRGQKVSRDIRRADSGIDCGFAAYPVDGTGRKIEEMLEIQVDLPSTRMFRRPCYDA